MNIFILRHGEAEFALASDFQRELTPLGCQQVESAVTHSVAALSDVEQIFVSPLVRAQQSAEIVKNVLGDRDTETVSWLTPEAEVSEAIDAISASNRNHSILLVSHLPLVADLADRLCGNSPDSTRFATATLAMLHTDVLAAGCASMSWIKHVK